jgi:hypothetical protein
LKYSTTGRSEVDRRAPSIRWMHGALDEAAIAKAIDKVRDRAPIGKRSRSELGQRESALRSQLLEDEELSGADPGLGLRALRREP